MKRPISGLMALSVLLSGVTVHARFDIKPQANGKVSLQVCDSAIRKGVTYEITSNKSSMKATLVGKEDLGCTETINVTSSFAPAGATLTVKKLNGDYDIDTAQVPGGNSGNTNNGTQAPPSALNSTLEIKKTGTGGAVVSLCNIKDGTKVTFQLDDGSENEFTPKSVTASEGCAQFSYDSDIVNSGYKVVVTANGIMKSATLGSNVLNGGSTGINNGNGGNNSGGNNNGGNSGNNGGGITQPTPPPAPQLKKVSEYEIKLNAKQAADNFMDEVINYYGIIELVRSNIREGFLQGEETFNQLNGDYSTIPSFTQGYNSGLSKGETAGYDYGTQTGENRGSQVGRTNAVQRFESIVNTGKAPDLSYSPQAGSYAGQTPNLSAPVSIREQLRAKENEIAKIAEQRLKQNSIGIIIDGSFVELFSTKTLWSPSFKDELKNNWWGNPAQYAYEYWRDRTDKRLNTKFSSQHQFLQIISGSDYENPEKNRMVFRDAFKEQFENQFAKRWNQAVNQYEPLIQKEGRAMYMDAATKYARDLGYNRGYETSFKPATIQGFNKTYLPAQEAAFDSIVQRYTTQPQITQVLAGFENVSLKKSPRPRSGAPGDQIKFSINSVTNVATVTATLAVTVLNEKLASYQIGASTKSNQVKDYGVVATLPNSLPFGPETVTAQVSITGNVGHFPQSQSFEISLRGYLQKLSMMPNGQEKYNYGMMLVNALRNEWPKASDGDDYDNKSGTLLHQVVAVATQLTPQDRAAIKTLVPTIKSAFPTERPGFFSGIRDDWDAAMALIDKI